VVEDIDENLNDGFGIVTLHSPVKANEGESWQETSNHETRVLKLILAPWEPTEDDMHIQYKRYIAPPRSLPRKPPSRKLSNGAPGITSAPFAVTRIIV
jgi:hypothetical protein